MLVDRSDIAVVINNFNKITSLQALINWLISAGHRNIIILDNDSKYPPLRAYYSKLPGCVKLVQLKKNYGYLALWHSDYINQIKAPFVYTDPDIVPTEFCPIDAVDVFQEIAQAYPRQYDKIGFGLKIDDIPDCYGPKLFVCNWEKQFWSMPVSRNGNQMHFGCKLYKAPLDTTFALYTETKWGVNAIRTGEPYLARHTDWYVNSQSPTAEDVFYDQHARGVSWGVSECRSELVKSECKKTGGQQV